MTLPLVPDSKEPANIPNKTENTVLKFLTRILREVLAILVWGYVIVKVFIFDIDIYILQRLSPQYVWVLNYKFFILIGAVAFVLVITKNKALLTWFLFVFFYPIIILFWRVPFFVFKQRSWNLVFALLDAIISIFKNLKTTFVTTTVFLILTVAVLGFSNKVVMWVSVVVLTLIVLLVCIQRLILVIKPTGVYEVYSGLMSVGGENIRKSQLPETANDTNPVRPDDMDETQLEKWKTDVAQVVMQNRICLFTAKKLRSYHDSGFLIIASVLSTLILVLYTAFSFAIINLGLYKINHLLYLYSSAPTFFTFLYYSFSKLLNSQIPEIVPAMPVSQVASMVESFFSLFLLGIFVSLVFTVRNQRTEQELDTTIKKLKEEGLRSEEFVRARYRFNTIEEAMDALRQLKAATIDLIYKITEMTE